MLSDRFLELEDPPPPEEIELWRETRAAGRCQYVWRGAAEVAIFLVAITLLAKWTVWAWFAKDVVWWGAAVAGLAGLVKGAMLSRDRWEQNEGHWKRAFPTIPTSDAQ